MPGGIPSQSTGRLTRMAGAPTARDSSTERSDAPTGQGETEPEGPPDPERFLLGGHQLFLVQGPSTEGPKSVSKIVHFKVGESTEGSNRRTSPHRRPVAYKPHGKATKCPSPQADPVTTSEEEIGLGGPSSSGEKKAAQSKPPSPPKMRQCATCGKACRSLKVLNKH